MMQWYTAVFLGLLQGLAEFLPISSSGHLLLFETWFGIAEGGLWLTVCLHLATLLAVIVEYRRKLWQMLRHPWNLETAYLVLATVVTCGVVLVFHDGLKSLFTVRTLPYMFLICGAYLMLPGLLKIRKQPKRPWVQAAVVGLAQGLAVVPGLSRSGLTITTGRLMGMETREATDFSFLLSIPIILGSLVYEIVQGGDTANLGVGNVLLACISAFVAGVVALRWMLKLTSKIDLRWFAWYLLILGSVLTVVNCF